MSTEPGKWIAVEDELPTETTTVLCYSTGGHYHIAWYNDYRKSFMYYKQIKKAVTHWQYLSPPKPN